MAEGMELRRAGAGLLPVRVRGALARPDEAVEDGKGSPGYEQQSTQVDRTWQHWCAEWGRRC